MEVLVERCAGLDVGKADLKACVRVPGARGRRQEIRTFATTTRELLELREWLEQHQVTVVGMEATGDYWKPVYYLLEDALQVQLLNAAHMHNVPGRKTDVSDSAWIARLIEHGLVRPSFVPPPLIRRLRDLTRYRSALIVERTREKQRLDKVLEDAGIKLSVFVSDIFGVSGRAMLNALIDGERDPAVLAAFARGRMRPKIPALIDALTGYFHQHHAFLCRRMLARIDAVNAVIDVVTAEIDREIEPLKEVVERLDTSPGSMSGWRRPSSRRLAPTWTGSPRPVTWRLGPACVRGTTSRRVNTSPVEPERETDGFAVRSAKPRRQRPVPTTPTCRPSSGGSQAGEGRSEPWSRSPTA